MLASKLSLKRRLFYVLTSLIVSMAYVSMLLFEIFDPVLLIISREWLIPLLLAYIVFLLYTEVEMRIICLLAGSIHGEVLYAIIIKKITSNNMVGSLAYLDVISVASVIILAWYGIERLAAYFNHHFQQLEEENQKTS